MKPFRVAIHPDNYAEPGAKFRDSAAPLWAKELEARGCDVVQVNVYRPDILQQLEGCDGFMWRWIHAEGMSRTARRVFPVLENTLGLATYPDQATCWHYDDKLAQTYLLDALNIPTPRNWVWFELQPALDWLNSEAVFPIVLKLSQGAGSQNVMLLHNKGVAGGIVRKLFQLRVTSLVQLESGDLSEVIVNNGYEPQTGYAYFQEFISNNAGDIRITVIGNRAFGFCRGNRKDDFRASGSGLLDYDPTHVPEGAIRAAFFAARKLGMQSVAFDILNHEGRYVIVEISYTYVAGAVEACAGHWVLDGEDADTSPIVWKEGQMAPETAQIEDFMLKLERCRAAREAE